jgi:hypothetical protein
LVEQIRSMQALVPGFELLTQPLDRFQRPRGHQSLPESFFVPLELALKRAPRFAESVAITPLLIRDMLDHGTAFLPVAVEAERFARGIRRAVFMKRGDVGKLAFDAYRLAQAMNLALDIGLVVPEVEDIKASFRSRRRAAAPAATPAPAANANP